MMQETNEAARQSWGFTPEGWVLIIGAVANAILLLRTNWSTKAIKQETQQIRQDAQHIQQNLIKNTDITQETLTETRVVSGHVNSERSKLDERIVSKERENEILTRQLDDQSKTAALLAATAARTVSMRQPDPNQPHNRRAEDKAAADTLAQIEANTRETADGIQELKG